MAKIKAKEIDIDSEILKDTFESIKTEPTAEPEANITDNFLKHDEVKLSDIRLVGGLFNSFLEKAGLNETFKNLPKETTLTEFQNLVIKGLYKNDEAFKEFNILINHIIKKDIEELKGDELQNTLNYCFAFIQKITSQGFFSNITTWFLTAIKG